MKKIFLSLMIVCLSILTQAQVNVYQYDSGVLDEESISKILVSAENDGIKSDGLNRLNKELHRRMQEQQDILSGKIVQKVANPNTVNSSGCVNPGFENGTNNGWNLFNGSNSGHSLPCNTCPTSPGAINTIVTATSSVAGQCTNGTDNYGNFPVIAPAPNPGGTNALLLNDVSAGYKMQKANYSYVVNSTNEIFTFQYAAVLQSGGGTHSPAQQPYFHVDVTDNTTGAPITCTQYDATAPASGNLNGWSISTLDASVYYKPWTTISVDLSAAIGHTVTLSYVVSDCNQGGHWGYAYIDGDCGAISVTNVAGICNGNNANLCGPPGYSAYAWTGPQTGSAQCLSTGTAGTYTLNMTSALSCPAPVLTYTVTASALPTANFSYSVAACSLVANFTDLSTVPSPNTITNWSWDFGDGQTTTSTTSGNTQAHTYTANGSYSVVMTCTTAAGCVGTFTKIVPVNGSLSTPVTTASVSCNGGSTGSATITPTGGSGVYTYTWSPSGGNSSVATGLGAGTYTCAVSDGAGCNNTTIAAIGQPIVLSSTSSMVQTTCGQFNGSATINMSGGTGPYTYTWSPSGGNTATISGVAAATYTCNVTDSHSCSYSTPVSITNLPGPSITSISSTSVTCFNGTNGTAFVSSTGTGLTYTWSPSGGNAATASGLANGVYTVSVKDGTGCLTTTVVTVNQATDIVPTSSISPSSCSIPNGSATVTAIGGTGSYSYNWTPSGGSANTASGLGAGSYVCTIKDVNNCTKTVSVFITTTTGPTVSVVGSTSVTCNGGNNGTATVTASGGTGSLTYSWSPSGGNGVNAIGLPAGPYTLLVKDSLGCLQTTAVTIAQPSTFSTPVSTTSVSCNSFTNGAATVNTSGGTGPYTYTWSPSSVTSTTNTASNLGVGTYTCNILDAHNCPTFTIAVISQPTPISASVTTASVSCHGGNNGAATAVPSGGVGPFQFTWAPFGGNNAPAINLTAGTYTTTITDANLCTFTITSIIAEPAAVTSVPASTNILCHGTHNGSATVTPSGGTGAYTYSWTPSGGNLANTPSTLAPGTYTCTIKDVNLCSVVSTFTITEPAVITVTSTVTAAKCNGGSNGSASVTITGGVPTYSVNWSTNPIQTGTHAINLSLGSYTATIMDANGCTKTKNVTIISPEPKDTLAVTGTLCNTDPNVLLSAPNATGISSPYQWYDSSTPITGATSSNYTAIQATVHDYAVTWYYNGCIYVTTKILETIQSDLSTFSLTNVFTPNADKINDDFYPFSIHSNSSSYTSVVDRVSAMLKEYEVFVYDRWGILMYSSTKYAEPWDGKHAGKDVPDGTYYWIVNYKTNCNNNTGQQKIKGFVELLR